MECKEYFYLNEIYYDISAEAIYQPVKLIKWRLNKSSDANCINHGELIELYAGSIYINSFYFPHHIKG